MQYTPTDDALAHHAANAAAIVIPVGAAVLQAPYNFTWVTVVLGAIWYLILIGEWAYKKYRSIRYGSRNH